MLHAIAGGAAARPFITHHNTLDLDLYLRIAIELHLKRLMVGGIERVYEIGRVFRNEGIDGTHNPEFTMIEVYQAYGDYESMMDLTEAIIVDAARTLSTDSPQLSPPSEGGARGGNPEHAKPLQLPWDNDTLDFTPPWPRKTYAELFEEQVGCEMHVQSAVEQAARQREIETDGVHPDVVVHELFEAVVEDQLIGPLFVIDYPASICPLTKRKRDEQGIAERFELFIQGMEIANAYTELNDPRLQEELFRTQLAGLPEEESMAKMDHDFLRALKVGMPPAGGLGIGVDRLVMLLTNSRSIRDVIFFPLLRPEGRRGSEEKGIRSKPGVNKCG